MNHAFLMLLSLSVSGSILTVIMSVLKPLIKGRVSQTWQYYIWILVILRFILPYTSEINIIGHTAQYAEQKFAPAIQTVTHTEGQDIDSGEVSMNPETSNPGLNNRRIEVKHSLWILWVTVMLMMLLYKVISYKIFIRLIKIRSEIITDEHILNTYKKEQVRLKVRRRIPLYVNNRINTPMLIGFLRPAIVIPDLAENTDKLTYTLRHELIHYKHKDILYKWFVQVIKCLHWFNPFVYLMGKQIDKCCELSCDEAVICHMSENERETYGDVLIASLRSSKHNNAFVASLAMNENVKSLKERLDMIMRYRKMSGSAVVCITVLTIILMAGASVIGAYAAPPSTVPQNEIRLSDYEFKKQNENVVLRMDFQNNTKDSISLLYFEIEGYNKDGDVILSSVDHTNDLGKELLTGQTVAVYITFPQGLQRIKYRLIKYETINGMEVSLPETALEWKWLDVAFDKSGEIILDEYSFFLIGGTTPAIRPTFKNLSSADIKAVNVAINIPDYDITLHCNANMDLQQGETATHSGWGLVNGTEKIRMAVQSYTTEEGEIIEILPEDLAWYDLSVNIFKQNNPYIPPTQAMNLY